MERRQGNGKQNKNRCKVGFSPRNAHSVSLILNIETGLVSPQYQYHMMICLRQPQELRQGQYLSQSGSPRQDSQLLRNQKRMMGKEQDTHHNPMESRWKMQSMRKLMKRKGPYVTRSGRISRAPERWNLKAFESILEHFDNSDWDVWCEKELFAFKARAERVRYLHLKRNLLKLGFKARGSVSIHYVCT
jgi:hypothetical protein